MTDTNTDILADRLVPEILSLKADRCRFSLEFGRGETYANSRPTLYALGRYPRHSVLYGQERRIWVEDFDNLAAALDALAAVRKAVRGFRFDNCCDDGDTTYVPIAQVVAHLHDDTDYDDTDY